MEVEIVGARQSTYVRVVAMACEEKQIPYAVRPMAPHSPEINAIHPFGRIPVIRHGDITLFESKAICTYLDKAFPGAPLIPRDDLGAGRVEQWISVVNTMIEPTWTVYFRAHYFSRAPGGGPEVDVIARQLPAMREQVGVLERAVSTTQYLAGPDFTLADIAVLPILHYLGLLPEGHDLMAKAPSLRAYVTQLNTRSSVRATMPPPMPVMTNV